MKKYKCIIVDDEPIAIEIIRSYINHFSDIEVVAECRNPIKAIEAINKENIDLMFLDIQMPELSGLELAESLSISPKIIFTTAFRDYAPEGFDLEALDYLLKPISLPRFTKAVNKFYLSQNPQLNNTIVSIQDNNKTVLIKENKRYHKVNISDIFYVQSMREYLFINTLKSQIKIKQTLDCFEMLLPQNIFVRIHKSYMVNISKISSFDSISVKINDIDLPISRSYKIDTHNKLIE